jgi:nitroreductase/dihydropteridine reductase
MEHHHLLERYTVKKYDPTRKVSDEDIHLLTETFRLSPSSLNLQGWKLVVVHSDEMKAKLSAAGQHGNMHRIKDCSHVFIFTRKRRVGVGHFRRIIEETAMTRITRDSMGVSTKKLAWLLMGYKLTHGWHHWVTAQLYIPLGMMLAVCAERGIGSTPMEGITAKKADAVLGLRPGYTSVLALAVGYPHPDDSENPSKLNKDRFPAEEVIAYR